MARPNRFLVHVDVDGERVHAFCPNPGRLGEFLSPGRPMLIMPRAANGALRKTVWDHVAFERHGRWFVTDTRVANALFAEAFAAGRLPEFASFASARPEVKVGASRFDFRLDAPDAESMLVEVKSVSLFHEEGSSGLEHHTHVVERDADARFVARFPDAPTTRGARHLTELAALAREGRECAVFFVVAATGATHIEPFRARDPVFADALADARDAGVRLLARESTCDGREIRIGARVPVHP